MKENKFHEKQSSAPKIENKISVFAPLSLQKEKKENLFAKKGKEFLKNKKEISVRHIFEDNKKLKNIDINLFNNIKSNLNIHRIKLNLENKDNSNKSKAESQIIRDTKMKTVILGETFNEIKNNLVLSVKLNKKMSHDIESSYKMEKLLEKNIKKESSNIIKKEEFVEFYINNNDKNKIFHDNYISTTKYNLLTFIPKGLLFQFSRLSNVYFLFTAIIQSIPIISPLNALTAIVPLIFVLGVSLIREAIEDLVRNSYDRLNNQEEVIVFRKNKFVKSTSQTLRLGEIVLIYENKNIPADMILIDSGFGEGICYVETSSLDGEKTLKLRVSNKYTNGFISEDIKSNRGIEKFIQAGKYVFDGNIKINSPNADLNYINGKAHLFFKKNKKIIEQDINLSTNEFILKGSILKNTNWIIGIVVYTGMHNKIILNSKKPSLKMSKVEKTLNYFLLFVLAFLIICCIICAIYHHVDYIYHKKYYQNFILLSETIGLESFIVFFTYFLLLNTLIPISLIVSIEIIKMIQSFFIKWDITLYSKVRHCFCDVKSVSIIEELGNVNFIFSDKTGTLTKNELEFKYCIIENKFYKYIKAYGIANKKTFYNEEKKKKSNKNVFLNFFENNKLENSKLQLIDKLDINESIANDNKINNDFNNFDNLLNGQNKSNNIIPQEESYFIYNKSISIKENGKSPSIDKIINKNKKNNKRNSSNFSKGSHNSQIDKNSQNISSIQINIHKEKNEKNKIKKNSTILEANNENLNSFSSKYDLIEFCEGYFSNPDNNDFLRNTEDNLSLNYIHEFWKALALTNECMVKDEKGDIKYIGTSPDDLELVKAAMNQGYKLIETSINSKIIRIAGNDYSFEILKVLGFSSERKRMSIIVRDQNGIKLYSKGADSEISKRLSKKSIESENYEIISNGLIEYSKRGLRTLMIAYRKIRDEDYDSWIKRLTEDEFNVENKQKIIERLYDIIENNLTLLGGTVVEDKLQDKVPETIKELRTAGIKIWVLTGDKLDTAENIGYSCNLLSKEQKLFILKNISQDDDKKVKDDPYGEMTKFFIDFQDFIRNLIKKYNLESKYMIHKSKYPSIDNNFNESSISSENDNQNLEEISPKRSRSTDTQIIDFESFQYLRDKNLLEPFSIIVEAPILSGLFKDNEWTYNFLHIAYYSNTVICCRVSPSQKSQVVKKIKSYNPDAVTLAIGDGGNDVSMIMEANIGIGIFGEEGNSAVQASDFSIGEFKVLKNLLFIHGRINLFRISKMILYFFFKNFVFTMTQFYFTFFCLGSGQTFIDDWYIACYNLIFTSIPLGISALTDTDVDLNDPKIVKKNLALLYKENRDEYRIFTFTRFLWILAEGIIISLMIFIISCAKQVLTKKGFFVNIWFLSLNNYICILFAVSLNLLIINNFIVIYLPLSILIVTFLLFLTFLVFNHYGIFFEFNSKASIVSSLQSPLLYLSIIFISCFTIIIDYGIKLFNIYFSKSLSSRILLRKILQKERKSFFLLNNNNPSSKSVSNNKANSYTNSNSIKNINKINIINKSNRISKLTNTFINHQTSNNYLIIKSPNYILNKINENDAPNKGPNSNKFSLEFRNINEVVNYNDNIIN